jgi:hypothetical protein
MAKEKQPKRVRATFAAIIAGALIIIAGISGERIWVFVRDIVTSFVDFALLDFLFFALISISSLGGIAVIIGALFIYSGSFRTGKLFVFLGTGMGLIGVMIALFTWIIGGAFPLSISFMIGLLGAAFSIYARRLV